MDQNYRHFNAKTLVEAAQSYAEQIDNGNQIMVTLAGAMSTAEIGISLAEMIRNKKVHAICCTGANLEEDLFNLVAHEHYLRIPDWRALTAKDEENLMLKGLNRVTDTCIPEEQAMRKIDLHILNQWKKADADNSSYFPHEFIYQLFDSEILKPEYQIDVKDSWLYAAWQHNLPIFTPGWEDSTLGNMFVSQKLKNALSNFGIVKSGLEQMANLINWYQKVTKNKKIGFFQIGGGIAGDFPICVVPLLNQDLKIASPLWSYFCQISDSTTSFGSYSGAVPNEKITWGKLDSTTPKFIIESDATIVAPLIFAYVLGK
jgi:deoxyhypusine synthase